MGTRQGLRQGRGQGQESQLLGGLGGTGDRTSRQTLTEGEGSLLSHREVQAPAQAQPFDLRSRCNAPPTPTPGYGRTPPAPPRGWTGLVGSGPMLRSSPARLAHCRRGRPGHGPSPPIPLVWVPWGWHMMAKRSVTPSQAALLAQALLQEVPGLLHLPESPRGAAPQSPQPSWGQGEQQHGRGRSLT